MLTLRGSRLFEPFGNGGLEAIAVSLLVRIHPAESSCRLREYGSFRLFERCNCHFTCDAREVLEEVIQT